MLQHVDDTGLLTHQGLGLVFDEVKLQFGFESSLAGRVVGLSKLDLSQNLPGSPLNVLERGVV